MSDETVGEVELEAEGEVLEDEIIAADEKPLTGVAAPSEPEGPETPDTATAGGDTVAEVELEAAGEALQEFLDRSHEDPFAPKPPEGWVEHPEREHVYVPEESLTPAQDEVVVKKRAGKK
jgi:hypothetical protein